MFERAFPASPSDLTEYEEQGLPVHYSDGIFESQEIREAYLNIALRKISEAFNCKPVHLSEIQATTTEW